MAASSRPPNANPPTQSVQSIGVPTTASATNPSQFSTPAANAPSDVALEDPGSSDEAEVAAQWHQACPTLKTIILPEGRVWFQSQGKLHNHGSAAAASIAAAVVAATGGGDADGAQEGGSGSQPQVMWAAL